MADVPDLIQEKRRHARVVALGGVIVAAALVGGWLLWKRHGRATALDRMAETWSSFARCLVGDVKTDKHFDDDVRAIQLGNVPPEQSNPWPGRCAHAYDAFRAAVTEAEAAGASGLDAIHGDLVTPLDLGPPKPDDNWWRSRVETLFEDVGKRGLPVVASTEPLPPAMAAPLPVIFPLGKRTLERSRDDVVTLFDGARACGVAVATGTAHCFDYRLPSEQRYFVPLDEAGKPAFAFAGLEDRHGIYETAGGERIWLGHGHEGVSRDQAFAALGVDPDVLVRWRDAKLTTTKLPDANATLVGDLLTWAAHDHLFVQRVLDDKLGPVVDAGQATGALERFLCSAGDMTVYAGANSDLWFAQGGGWVRATLPRSIQNAGATCVADAVRFAVVDRSVSTFACKSTGCDQPRQAPNLVFESPQSAPRAAVLGDKVLLIGDGAYPLMGLWMRLAPLEQLATAHQTFVSKDAYSVEAIAVHGTTALVVAHGNSNLSAIRVDAAGHYAAVGE